MTVRVLGCSGSIAAGQRTTAFLVDGDILIDAGTGVGDLTLEEMARIDHIFLTHSHLDHVLAIPLLADSVIRLREGLHRGPVVVHALAPTLKALKDHVLNGVIWPDFTRLPRADRPVLAFEPLALGDVLEVEGRRIEVLPAVHTVPACGYAVQWRGSPAWVYTGDTGPNPALWQRLAHLPLAALVIETAFRDDEASVAHASQHLCPSLLRAELAQLASPADVYITHIKPGEMGRVMDEIGAQASHHRIRALEVGQSMLAREGRK
jgi:ribonuclease BN (tRNA processing enzyme)